MARDAACAHGCCAEPTVMHADGRELCRPCYDAEVDVTHGNPGCPTCGPVGTVGRAAARVSRCPYCGKPIPPDTGPFGHFCTGPVKP